MEMTDLSAADDGRSELFHGDSVLLREFQCELGTSVPGPVPERGVDHDRHPV
jgi:hypothetical protein